MRLESEKKRTEKSLQKIEVRNENNNSLRGLKNINPRKRRVSGDSMITVNSTSSFTKSRKIIFCFIDQNFLGSRVKYIPNKSARLNTPDQNSLTPNPLKDWEEPKNGWCTDEVILQRRSKVL